MSALDENKKVDWLNTVKKHRRKQKGLPALSKLNTNAGNVEKNIEIFNSMQSSGFSTDAVNGNTSSVGVSESVLDDNFDMSMRTLL